MRIGIMGAGAVGCYYGALLARAGHDVTLIGRPALVAQVRTAGLRLQTADLDTTVAVRADTYPAGLADADIVLFCVKSSDTETAGRAMAPHLKPGAVILSLQNGVDNSDRLAATLGRPVIPVVVYVATDMAGPGHVRHHGRGDLILGPAPASAGVAALLQGAGIPATVSDGVVAALWEKLITNCAYNALSAVPQLPYGALLATDNVAAVMTDLVTEGMTVARALGIPLKDDLLDRVLGLASTMPGQYSSTAQDLARGKPSEIDHLNGHIVRQGAALGIPTPVNRTLHVLVKLMERNPDHKPHP